MKFVPQSLAIMIVLSFTSLSYSMNKTVLSRELQEANRREVFEVLSSKDPAIDQIKYFLDNGVSVKSQHGKLTILAFTAKYGHTAICKLLLSSGANLGDKPLWLAAKYGHASCCEFLLKNGALINERVYDEYDDGRSKTPLEMAIENDHTQACAVLLQYGAKIDYRDSDEGKSLAKAISGRNAAIVKLLLEYGARPLWVSHLGNAVRNNDYEICKLLLEYGASINILDKESGSTAFHSATKLGHLKIAKLLLEYGANIFILEKQSPNRHRRGASLGKHIEKSTPLHHAAVNGHAEVCKTLITESICFPKLGSITDVRRTLKTLRLCMKRICRPLGKDMFFYILGSSKELRELTTRLALFLFKQKRPFPLGLLSLVQEGLTDLRIQEMKPLMTSAYFETTDDEVKDVLKAVGFEERLRDDIHEVSKLILKGCHTSSGGKDENVELLEVLSSLSVTKKLILGSVLCGAASILYWLLSRDKKDTTSSQLSEIRANEEDLSYYKTS